MALPTYLIAVPWSDEETDWDTMVSDEYQPRWNDVSLEAFVKESALAGFPAHDDAIRLDEKHVVRVRRIMFYMEPESDKAIIFVTKLNPGFISKEQLGQLGFKPHTYERPAKEAKPEPAETKPA